MRRPLSGDGLISTGFGELKVFSGSAHPLLAKEIADFLASANPGWEQVQMRQMMKGHITQTIGYASDVLAGNYDAALEKYDEAEAHMTEMADMLTAGLVEQFPDKF